MAAKKTIIIVGKSDGALEAAQAVRAADEHARIIMVGEGEVLPCTFSVSQFLLDPSKLWLAEGFAERFDVVIKNARPLSLDVDARCLLIKNQGKLERLSYDQLIFAQAPTNKSAELPEFSALRTHFTTLHDAQTIAAACKSGAQRAVVIGAGSCGLRAASILRTLGLEVAVIEQKRRIMPEFSLHFACTIVELLQEQGIEMVLGEHMVSADYFYAADLIIEAVGLVPNTQLLSDSGAAVGFDGLIRVDDHMQTTLPGVFACGSAIVAPFVFGSSKWVKDSAIMSRSAEIAGANASMAGGLEKISSSCFALQLEVFAHTFGRTGLSELEARKLFSEERILVTTVFDAHERKACIKLIVDRQEQKLMGAEIFAHSNVAHSLDLLSVAIKEGFSPQRLIDLDTVPSLDDVSVRLIKEAAAQAKIALISSVPAISAEQLAFWSQHGKPFYLLPTEDASAQAQQLAKDSVPIVLYSSSGHRSSWAERALHKQGLKNIYHLDGGAPLLNLIAKE